MAKANPKRLLVEGADERRVIPFFMDEHVVWGDKPADWIVSIEEFEGVDNLLKPGVIEAESKVPGLEALGVIVDADDLFDSRWARVRERCLQIAADVPEELPSEGLIHAIENGPRIGVWIMPDNRASGMLETFLSYLLVPELAPLWSFARETCEKSREHGAPYKDAHCDKANIHTYLSWLDPPGRSLQVEVLSRAFDARLPLGERFVRWFMDLYQLAPRQVPLP